MARKDDLNAAPLKQVDPMPQHVVTGAVPWSGIKRRVVKIRNFPWRLRFRHDLRQPGRLLALRRKGGRRMSRYRVLAAIQRKEVGQAAEIEGVPARGAV